MRFLKSIGFFNKDIGIDLGTANTLVHLKGKGMVVNEPSVVAISARTGKVLAVGNEAKEMIGRTPGNIMAIRPMKDGVIADFDVTQNMLKYFIKKAMAKSGFGKPRVIVCVPSGVTEVEKRAVEEATMQVGVKEVYLMEEPMAAAIGANLPVEEPVGCMIVDIGGGTTEIAVISLGGIVTSRSLKVAGEVLDDSISTFIKKEYNLLIGDRTAEDIKKEIGSAFPKPKKEEMNIRGRDLLTGLPKNITITSNRVMDALREPISQIIEAIKDTLEKTPPELSADIMNHGITLAGGGALLYGLDKLIKQETGIDVNIAADPLDCVALGAGRVSENMRMLKKVMMVAKK